LGSLVADLWRGETEGRAAVEQEADIRVFWRMWSASVAEGLTTGWSLGAKLEVVSQLFGITGDAVRRGVVWPVGNGDAGNGGGDAIPMVAGNIASGAVAVENLGGVPCSLGVLNLDQFLTPDTLTAMQAELTNAPLGNTSADGTSRPGDGGTVAGPGEDATRPPGMRWFCGWLPRKIWTLQCRYCGDWFSSRSNRRRHEDTRHRH
jgi:hypothetical protein